MEIYTSEKIVPEINGEVTFPKDLMLGIQERDLLITKLNMICHHLIKDIEEGKSDSITTKVAILQYQEIISND